MAMTPNQTRILEYPIAVAVIAGLSWAAFGYTAEADFLTLVNSASVHAQLAGSIPADADNTEGRELRERLVRDAHGFLERAERVEPDTSAACQVRAFLALLDGRHDLAVDLYRRSRELEGCTRDQLGRLAMHEAKALSNAGRPAEGLAVLAQNDGVYRDEDRVQLAALRSRLSFRDGDAEAARRYAIRIVEAAVPGDGSCLVGASLLEGLGDYVGAEAAYRESGLREVVREYVIARLKLRAGETDTAQSLLGRSAETGDPEVLRLARQDEELWVDAIGVGGFKGLTDPTTRATPPGAGR